MLPEFRKNIFFSVAPSLRPSGKSGFKMKLESGACVEWYRDGKPKLLGEIALSVTHCSPQIPHGLAL